MAGLELRGWHRLFWDCHEIGYGGIIHRIEWPDGGAVEDQPHITIAMFDMIRTEEMAILVRKIKDV